MIRAASGVTTIGLVLLLSTGPGRAQQSSILSPAQSPSGSLLDPARPAIRSLYLDATPSTPESTVVPGRPFPLAVDVFPKKGMRVYAPGNKDYTPVALTIDPQLGLVVDPAKYPKSEEYLFAPLNERVRVYQGPFRLTRDVKIAASPGATLDPGTGPALTIRGRLEYQACDDKVCYLPQTVALTWVVAVKRS